MSRIALEGMIPAAIMPMGADLELNEGAYSHYLDWLIEEGAVALAINMDTGEGPQLTLDERRRAAEIAVSVARGRASVLAGVMAATTPGAVEMGRIYQRADVDALVVFPNPAFRNAPLDPRIPYGYHKAIADGAGLPLVLFQLAPVFGGVCFSRETLLRLFEIPEVIAIKEASFDAQVFAHTVQTLTLVGRPITMLTGNDRFITESFLLGAKGALLGFGAIGCRMVAEMADLFARGEHEAAVAMRPRVQGFADFIYKDPMLDYRARCKAGLAHLGVIAKDQIYVRPPLLVVNDEEYDKIGEALESAGMLASDAA